MRPSLRLLSLEATPLQGTRTRYVCSGCRQEARPRPLVARQFLRNASDDSLTERVRRRIWGTDNPPGQKDPYGGEGLIEQKWKKSQTSRQQEEQNRPAAEPAKEEELEAVSGDYEPAATSKGLQHIGHLGKWTDYPPTEVDTFTSFHNKRRFTMQGHLDLAAHQTAVELCLMHSLNKPLTDICEVIEHDENVFKLILRCKMKPQTGSWDSALVYPDQQAEEALAYIFKQLGAQETPTEQTAEDVEKAEANEAEAAEEFEEVEEEPRKSKRAPLPFLGFQAVKDKGYLDLSLTDPTIKFAFLKRFAQLTGHYFNDPAIVSFTSIKQVLEHLEKALAPKPKKLHEHLTTNDKLKTLSNVKIFVEKQKPFHKDEELGRQKIIDAEFRKRGIYRRRKPTVRPM